MSRADTGLASIIALGGLILFGASSIYAEAPSPPPGGQPPPPPPPPPPPGQPKFAVGDTIAPYYGHDTPFFLVLAIVEKGEPPIKHYRLRNLSTGQELDISIYFIDQTPDWVKVA